MNLLNFPLNDREFETEAVHAGREDLASLGVHALPIDLSSTYPTSDLDVARLSLENLAKGERSATNPVYARLHNPTVHRFECALARLEAMPDAVSFASGMAALTAVLLVAKQRGEHVVAVRPVYGTSDHLLSSDLLGLEVTWVEAHRVADAITPETSLVVIETPANPTLRLVDIDAVVRQAGDVPVLVDSTFATPVLQTPGRFGASFVLHSATKFLGGHGDVVGGVVATDSEFASELRAVRVATGALLHPLAGYLLHRGLSTLALRVRAAQTTAGELARWLSSHSAVERVYYPGLVSRVAESGSAAQDGLLARQMKGPGTVLAFELEGGRSRARSLLGALRLVTPAVSLGSVDSLIQIPSELTHRVVSEADRRKGGISPGLVRLSVGLESFADLRDDFRQALERCEDLGSGFELPGSSR